MDIHPAESAPLVSASDVNNNPTPSNDGSSPDGSPTTTTTPDTYFPDPDVHNPTAEEITSWFAEFTSIHGIYYMFERGHFKPWKTYAWTAFVLAMAAFLLWALISEFEDFAQYSVGTTTKTIIPTSLAFPRVTICNANGGRSEVLQNITGITEPRDEEELKEISQPMEDFILYSEFNSQGVVDLKSVWTPTVTKMGLCYSFTTDEKVYVPGISAGLLVHTWLEQSSYPESTDWAGVKVFVDTNNNNANSQGMAGMVLVPPGAVSFLAVTVQDFQREEDEPWRECVSTDESIEQCHEQCIMNVTKDKCGCRLIGDNSNFNYDGTSSFPPQSDYCNSSNSECTSSLNDEDLVVCSTCSIPPCKEQRFTTFYSAGRLSQKNIETLQRKNTNINGNIISKDEISNNFVAIHVNYDSIRYEQTIETKSTNVWQLFSNLGGSFGFFMGISIISIVELFVELIGLRLLPILWGKRLLYGIGQKKFD